MIESSATCTLLNFWSKSYVTIQWLVLVSSSLSLPPVFIRLSSDTLLNFEVPKALDVARILQGYVHRNLPSQIGGSLVQK